MPKSKKKTPVAPQASTTTQETTPAGAPVASGEGKGGAGVKPVKQKASKVPAKPKPREMLYPEPAVEIRKGENALTLTEAQEIIGWEEVEDDPDSAVAELSVLLPKTHVRLNRNPSNRWLTPGWLLELKQEFLNKRWRFNGESIVIGQYGNVLSGQHRLLGFILAALEMQGRGKKLAGKEVAERSTHWKDVWGGEELTLDTVIVYGVEESDDVFKTLNCGKKGSFAEVLYRSTYFANKKPGDRKELARLTDWAVKMLWHRTGLEEDAYAPRRTHGEAMEFLAHHPRIIDAVVAMGKEYSAQNKNQEGGIKDVLTPGNAAGVLYLMAASSTGGEAYWNADPRQEGSGKNALVDFSLWDKACEFWRDMNLPAGPEKERMDEVRMAISRLSDVDPDSGTVTASGSLKEKLYVLANAWHYYVSGEEFTADDLKPVYYPLDEKTGVQKLKDVPTFGGIDRGEPSPEDDEAETVSEAEDNSEERKAALAKAHERAEANRTAQRDEILKRKAARKAAKEGASQAEGDSPGEGVAEPTPAPEDEAAFGPDGGDTDQPEEAGEDEEVEQEAKS